MIIRMVCGLALTAILFSTTAAYSQEVSSQEIVGALTQVKTRSIVGPPPLSEEDRKMFDALASTDERRIVIEEREKLTAAVEKYEMPSIDLDVYFDFDSSSIAAQTVPSLVQLGTALLSPELKGYRFLVTGHTDAKGDDDYNLTLSEDRAQSVKAYLTKTFGIAQSDLIAVGYGEEMLKSPDYPEAAENRRVTIIAVAP